MVYQFSLFYYFFLSSGLENIGSGGCHREHFVGWDWALGMQIGVLSLFSIIQMNISKAIPRGSRPHKSVRQRD